MPASRPPIAQGRKPIAPPPIPSRDYGAGGIEAFVPLPRPPATPDVAQRLRGLPYQVQAAFRVRKRYAAGDVSDEEVLESAQRAAASQRPSIFERLRQAGRVAGAIATTPGDIVYGFLRQVPATAGHGEAPEPRSLAEAIGQGFAAPLDPSHPLSGLMNVPGFGPVRPIVTGFEGAATRLAGLQAARAIRTVRELPLKPAEVLERRGIGALRGAADEPILTEAAGGRSAMSKADLLERLRVLPVADDPEQILAILPDGTPLASFEAKGRMGAFSHSQFGLPPVKEWLQAGVIRTGLEMDGTFFAEIRGTITQAQQTTLARSMRGAPKVLIDVTGSEGQTLKILEGNPIAVREQLASLQAPPPAGGLPPLPAGGLPSGRVPGGLGRQTPPPPRDPYQQVVAALEPEREPFLAKLRDALPQELYDRNFPLKELETATGIPARQLAQVVPGAQAAGEDIIRRFYQPVVRQVAKDEKFLEQYMVLQRMEDLLKIHPGTRLPGGLTGVADVASAKASLSAKIGPERFAQVEQAASELWRLNDEQVLKPLLKEGVISGEGYTALKSSHPHYIPFQRADFVDVLDQSFTGGRAEANLSATGIKKLTEEGSSRALDNPLRRLVAEPIKAGAVIARNKAARSIVQALEEMQRRTGEPLVKHIQPGQQGEHSALRETISFYQDGVKNTVEVPAIFGRVAKGLEAEPDNILLQVVRFLNAPLRRGAVEFNPFFLPVNVMRDAMAAMFREKVFPFGPDYMAGLWSAIRKNALLSEAAESGALMSGIVETMKGPQVLAKPLLGAIEMNSLSDALLLVPRLVASVPRAISGANVLAERGVRLGTFRQLRRQGLSALEAAVRTRDVTVDFAKVGHAMRVVNQVIPFSNAAVQGSALIVRTIRDHPVRSAAFASAFATAAIMERLNNMRFETSDLIPDYEYTRNWVIQLGEGTRKDETRFPIYVKVPKGEIAGLFTFPVEAMFHLARKKEDRSAAELLLKASLTQAMALSPVDPGLVPPVPFIQTGASLATGVDLFTGAPIIPRREERLLPEQQFGPDTSATAVGLGQQFKVSPRLIDFAIRDYLAGAGESANWLVSMGLEALGWERPVPFGAADAPPEEGGVQAAARVPGVRRFIGTRDTQEERRGWEKFREASASTNREFRRLPEMERLGLRLGEIADEITVEGHTLELTPSVRADVQRDYASVALKSLRAAKLSAHDAERQQQVKDILAESRVEVRERFLRSHEAELAAIRAGPFVKDWWEGLETYEAYFDLRDNILQRAPEGLRREILALDKAEDRVLTKLTAAAKFYPESKGYDSLATKEREKVLAAVEQSRQVAALLRKLAPPEAHKWAKMIADLREEMRRNTPGLDRWLLDHNYVSKPIGAR